MSSIVTYSTKNIWWADVTTVSYEISDWWIYDEDWIANWIIIDPSGPSTNKEKIINHCENLKWNDIKKVKISKIIKWEWKPKNFIKIKKKYIKCWDENKLNDKLPKKIDKIFDKFVKKIDKKIDEDEENDLIEIVLSNLEELKKYTDNIYEINIINYIQKKLKSHYYLK